MNRTAPATRGFAIQSVKEEVTSQCQNKRKNQWKDNERERQSLALRLGPKRNLPGIVSRQGWQRRRRRGGFARFFQGVIYQTHLFPFPSSSAMALPTNR